MKNVKVFATLILAIISIACTSDDDTPVTETTVTVKDFETTIDENPTAEQELGTIEATTNQGTLTYSFKSEEPSSAFAIDSKTGKLTVKEVFLFDYEARKTLTATVLIKNGNLAKEAKVTIHLNDIEDSNITLKDFETTIDENPTTGQELGTIEATTDQGELTYSLKNETPEGAFEIDTKTGKLTVKDVTLFDYETRTSLTATVVANHKEAKVIVNLKNVVGTINIKNFQTTIPEGPFIYQELGTIEATTDQGELIYSLKDENPEGALAIDSKTGRLTVKDNYLFDYEQRTFIKAIVIAKNKEGSKEANIEINLLDIEEIYFADINFKMAIIGIADVNGDGEIDIFEAQNVQEMDIQLKNISDLTGIEYFTSLTLLDCSMNNLTWLDLSKNTALTYLWCYSNKLTSLNIKNGNNNILETARLQNNPSLTCIEVDDPSASYLTNWEKDATANYSSDCTL